MIEAHDGTPVTTEDELRWYCRVRAIRTTSLVSDPFVTGTGYLNFHNVICADPRSDVRCSSPDVQLEGHELGHRSQRYWCYPVHDFCWEMLCYRVDTQLSISPKKIAHHLFALLYNTPTDGSGALSLSPRHHYGEAGPFQHLREEDFRGNLYNSDCFYLQHDPDEEFEFEFEPELALEFREGLSLQDISDHGSEDTRDALRSLPSEIIYLILANLPSSSICNLRLASRIVAALAKKPYLPQSFWSSRFEGDFEMAFVFAKRRTEIPPGLNDWRQVYLQVETMLKSSPLTYPGLRNRRHIWCMLGHILPALKLRLANESGIVDAPYSHCDALVEGKIQSGEVAGELDHGSTPPDLGDQNVSSPLELRKRCRLFERHALDWSKAPKEMPVQLGISFLHHDERSFISGLRLLSTSGASEFSRAGYINREDEQVIDLSPSDAFIKAVELNVTWEGLVGLRLILERNENAMSYSFGNMDVIGFESGIAKIDFTCLLSQATFLVGLDACKLVSLKLFEHASGELLPITESSRRLNGWVRYPSDPEENAPIQIWNPSMPKETESKQWHGLMPQPQTFNLFLDMDFGGPSGECLPSLCMVTAFMGDHPRVLFGFSFSYVDGNERHFGHKHYDHLGVKRHCVTQSFIIAGNKGELIDRVNVVYDKLKDLVQAVELVTNFGRQTTFRLHGNGAYSDDSHRSITTTNGSGPDSAITSFLVNLQSQGGHIRDFALRNVKYPTKNARDLLQKVMPPLEMSQTISSAKEMLSYPGGHVVTAAKLTGLRAIHLSKGDTASSRGLHHISGLRLEYSNGDYPLIMGQWINQFASMELDADERLTQITTWHDYTNRFNRVKFGPTIGMSFVTSKGTKRDFLLDKLDSKLCLKYQDNPFQTISSIGWVYNYQWDHVRFLYQPTNKYSTLIYGPTYREVPGYVVMDRLFLHNAESDGSCSPLGSIEVTFRHMGDEPVGISFIYRSGRMSTIGVRGERGISEDLEEDETLTKLEFGVLRANRLGSIVFYTDKNRKLTFVPKTRRPSPINAIHKTETHILHRLASAPASDNEVGTDRKHVASMPDEVGGFVGIWAIPRRTDGSLRYPMLGTIFEKTLTGVPSGGSTIEDS
ncbi:hypothetical protein JX265_010661 [Neoarthrinium moseri]|uniref:F-box domain-containing protein n=1 Tax=Neoarthrinium moseri TaxID=1658444 RepID=A0A9P9WDR7_9PEZI|nr:hypothetical protein JX265_010661 [Neoarthrinium moseri]